ncbi:calcium:proton antiporter [Kallotenue papyrolyticum]|uniref:calcium:proton antiporter n=1 Tax=Kallotenue papyrolyticum TaxID=1325125 RepID=UPI000478557F|nr:cation transporter [Kallotenue papyrolyticum]
MSRLLRYLLIFVPLAVLAELVFHNPLLIFITSALALIPLAGLLGEATEALAEQLGPQLGGLLNATLGNAAELIITIVAIRAGRYELVKASITGSILGNLLLIIGFALLLGGLRHGIQRFDRSLAGLAAALMTLAVIGLIIPTMFELTAEIADPTRALDVFNTEVRDPRLNAISLGVAAVLLTLYLLSLVYQFRGGAGQTAPVAAPAPGPADAPPAAARSVDQAAGPTSAATPARQTTGAAAQHNWSVPVAVGVLAASTLAIVFMSEFLVGVVEPVAQAIGVRELFLGVILIPIVGNVAEHLVGVQAAMNNQMDLSMNISLGSSMQIALFVAPLLVFVSLLLGPRGELTLFFSLFEVMALVLAVLIAAIISLDGESNWLEGAMLLAVYLIMAIGFFYVR